MRLTIGFAGVIRGRVDPLVLAVVRATNPWIDDPPAFFRWEAERRPREWVPRTVPAARDWPLVGKAHLAIGARQVGKSTYLRHFLATRREAPLILNAEELAIRGWARSPALAAFDLGRLTTPATPLFFEEVQHLDDAGLFVKGLVDLGVRNAIYVTGSSAYHLHARTRESLAGRAARATIHPLGLHEIAARLPAALPPALRAARLREEALQMAVWGGYPEVVTSLDKARVLTFLLESFILRDASDLFRIQHLDAFRRLLVLVAGQVGSLVNAAEWAGHCGVSRDTVQSYVDVLVETQVLQRVSPFVGGRRAEVTRQPKVYYCDNGVLSAVARRFEPFAQRVDRGAIFEGFVAAELRKHLDPLHPMDALRYWRSTSKAEVDFVVERPGGIVAFECKAAELKRPELSRSARSFIDAYRPMRFIVVNLALSRDDTVSGCRVSWRPPEWLVDPFAAD
jgi:hypothetical protein